MKTGDTLGNSGRKMDPAWRQAISEGMRKAKNGLSRAVVHGIKNENTRIRVLNTFSNAANSGKLLGAAWAKGALAGGAIGGTLSGAVNKYLVKNPTKLKGTTAREKAAIDAIKAWKAAGSKGPLKVAGKVVPIGALKGLKYGVGIGAKIAGAGAAVLTVAGGAYGALSKDTSAGKDLNNRMKHRVATGQSMNSGANVSTRLSIPNVGTINYLDAKAKMTPEMQARFDKELIDRYFKAK